MEALVQTQLTKYFEAKNKESNGDLEDRIAEDKMRTEYEAVYAEKTSSEQYLIQPRHLDQIEEVVKDLEARQKKSNKWR